MKKFKRLKNPKKRLRNLKFVKNADHVKIILVYEEPGLCAAAHIDAVRIRDNYGRTAPDARCVFGERTRPRLRSAAVGQQPTRIE